MPQMELSFETFFNHLLHLTIQDIFLSERSKQFFDDVILLICDGAAWHKSKALKCPKKIQLFFIPQYTPEMNPIEQIWKQIRPMGF